MSLSQQITDVVVLEELSVDGRQVLLFSDGHSEFWDGGDDDLFTVPHRVSEQAAEMYLHVYDQGRKDGEIYGRLNLQHELRTLLGVKP